MDEGTDARKSLKTDSSRCDEDMLVSSTEARKISLAVRTSNLRLKPSGNSFYLIPHIGIWLIVSEPHTCNIPSIRQLTNHIRDTLPSLRDALQKRLFLLEKTWLNTRISSRMILPENKGPLCKWCNTTRDIERSIDGSSANMVPDK
ncbi:unnamed protein product, partial [Mesorhabditis spiculigera]